MRKEIINEVVERLGAELVTVNKNGIDKTGISIKQGNVGLNIYPEMIDADNVDEAVDAIRKIVDAHRDEMQRIDSAASFYMDWEKVKPSLRARLYNMSVPAEVKRSAADKGFDDLNIVPYVEIKNVLDEGKGSIKVLAKHVDAWGVTEDEVINIALKNTENEAKIKSLADTMKALLDMENIVMPDIPEMNEYIVSVDGDTYGAAGILSKLDYFKQKFPKGFYVLPSSLHEVIVHAAQGVENEIEGLTRMVQEVNATTVDPEEKLADKAYAFFN